MVKKIIIIVGKGSIGLRHALNLKKLGIRVIFLRSRNLNNDFNKKFFFEETNDFMFCLNKKPIGCIICTPTIFHPENALKFLKHGIPVYIEKPIGFRVSKYKISRLKKFSRTLIIHGGYHLRYSKYINNFFKKIAKKKIKKIEFTWKTNTKEWHPWENYKDSYTTNYNLGGGVIHTLSHEIDLASSFFKKIKFEKLNYEFNKKDKIVTNISAKFYSFDTEIIINLDFYNNINERKIFAMTYSDKYEFDFSKYPSLQDEAYIQSVKDFILSIKQNKNTISNFENSLVSYKICERLLNET